LSALPQLLMASASMEPYAAILFVIGVVVLIAIATLILGHAIGPKRTGPVKQSVYESGMPAVTDARRRLNVRFYIIALLFLLFDVEVVLLWPWALAYYQAAVNGQTVEAAGMPVGKGFMLAGAGMFLILLLIGYLYEWKKGVFKWD
jgi:NADH-quinone oxidoreductase subunit A